MRTLPKGTNLSFNLHLADFFGTLGPRLGWFVRAGIVLYGFLFILYLSIRLTSGENSSLVAFVNNLLPWFCWLSIGLGLIGLLYRERWLLIGLQIPAAVTFLAFYGDLLMPVSPKPEPEASTLTVVMYNVCG